MAGGANSIIPGDRVNAFFVADGTIEAVRPDEDPAAIGAPFPHPRTELLLTNVLVLDVQAGTSPLQVSQAATQTPTAAASPRVIRACGECS